MRVSRYALVSLGMALIAVAVALGVFEPLAALGRLVLLDPKEPGGVKGTVTNESGADSARVMVAIYEKADSARASYRAVCYSTGAYEVKSVKPGE